MPPLCVEIIAYAPTRFYHCLHCEVVWQQVGHGQKIHAEQDRTGLPDDLRREYETLSDWVHGLFDRYGDRLDVRVIDVASVEGVLRALRYGVRRFPAIVVAGRERVAGGDLAAAEAAIERHLATAGASSPGRE
ncbi:MAG: hypothetical protein HY691_07575 [Chloroflexi bacterium]|nr:hypothetical protein [Chloroflexota bacterium]